jgi:hypothetical protein
MGLSDLRVLQRSRTLTDARPGPNPECSETDISADSRRWENSVNPFARWDFVNPLLGSA